MYGSTDQYPVKEAREGKYLGYCYPYEKSIHVLGSRRIADWKVVFDWEVLGHELIHILNAYNIDVADPDTAGAYVVWPK